MSYFVVMCKLTNRLVINIKVDEGMEKERPKNCVQENNMDKKE